MIHTPLKVPPPPPPHTCGGWGLGDQKKKRKKKRKVSQSKAKGVKGVTPKGGLNLYCYIYKRYKWANKEVKKNDRQK